VQWELALPFCFESKVATCGIPIPRASLRFALGYLIVPRWGGCELNARRQAACLFAIRENIVSRPKRSPLHAIPERISGR
jgi:hypothetical protein